MLDLIQAHEKFLWWIAGASLTALLVFPAVILWAVVRIPADYFAARVRPERATGRCPAPLWFLIRLIKNVIGGLFVLAGVFMLVLPGQGLLTIFIGISLMNFPGKFRLERWLITRTPVLRVVNSLRRARRRPALSIGAPLPFGSFPEQDDVRLG